MAMTMGVHDVAGTENPRQGRAHAGGVEDTLNLRDPGKDVVARIALRLHDVIETLNHVLVESRGMIAFDQRVAVCEEVSQVIVGEGMVCHGGHLWSFVGSGLSEQVTT